MKSVLAHALLALFGMTWAYQTWTRPPEQEQPLAGSATIAECDESQLASLEIETPTHTVKIRPKKGAQGNDYWITAQRKKPEEEKKPESKVTPATTPPEPAADKATPTKPGEKPGDKSAADAAKAAADPNKPAEPEKKKEARPYDPDAPVTFLANEKFRELLKGIAPLRAIRALGEIPKDKYEQFGFDKVGTFLRMECGGRKVALEIGGRTYGAGDRYVRAAKSKESYLLAGTVVSDLQSAQFKFLQSELHGFPLSETDEAVISAMGKQRKLMHRNRLVKEEARWVDAAAPDKRNELFGNWFQRLERLKAKAYLGEGKEPGSDLQIEATSVQPVMTIEYKLEGKPKDKLELVRVDTEQGGFYYARTGTTRRWVTMYDSLAKQVDEDVAMIVGAEEPPAESSSPPASGAAPGSPAAAPAPGAPPPAALPPGHPKVH